jgi:hypothetical protein
MNPPSCATSSGAFPRRNSRQDSTFVVTQGWPAAPGLKDAEWLIDSFVLFVEKAPGAPFGCATSSHWRGAERLGIGETVFCNARIVLPDEIVHGSLLVRDRAVVAIDAGVRAPGLDCDGNWLLPGLVELHTDHLESHYAPRPSVKWNIRSAGA